MRRFSCGGGRRGNGAASPGFRGFSAVPVRRTEWSLYELYLEKTMSGVKFRAGKLTPHLTSEYCQASSRIKTVERSALCNELIPISNWGLEANFQKDAKSLYHSYGVYLNANGTDLKDEIQFHSADNLFALNAMKWKVASPMWDSQTLGYQYAHNFTEWRGRKVPSSSDYCGTGAQDVLSLSWDASRGAFSNGQGLQRMVCFRGRPVQVLIPSCRYCSFLSTVGW